MNTGEPDDPRGEERAPLASGSGGRGSPRAGGSRRRRFLDLDRGRERKPNREHWGRRGEGERGKIFVCYKLSYYVFINNYENCNIKTNKLVKNSKNLYN